MSPAEAVKFREKENLGLARKRVLQQLASNNHPQHRELLQATLAELDERLRKLD
jgi:hypothetical protein